MKITWFNIFNKISILTLAILLIICSTLTIPASGDYPAEKKGSPEHYARDSELQTLEGLFFPHDFVGEKNYLFEVPKYLYNSSYGHYLTFDKEYRYHTIGDEKESDIPPDFKHANFTIRSFEGKYIYTQDNKYTNLGGGSTEGINFTGEKNLSVMITGGFNFFMFEYPEWDDILYKKQSISFTGTKRCFLLWGIDSGIGDFDSQEYFIRLKINADKPVRAYVFENTGKSYGELIDYDEKTTASKELDLIDRDKNVGVVCEPKLAFSTIDDIKERINITLEVEVMEIPENMWLLPVIVGSVFVFVVGATIWANRRKS